MTRLLPRLLAVLAPLLLVGGVLFALYASTSSTGPSPVAASMDARMKDGADVVLLGNSKVGTDLDLVALADAWSSPPGRVVPLHINGTSAPIWYAVLQQRVYAHGYTPRLIVVYATLTMIVDPALPSAIQRANLDAQLDEPDPVINAKVFGGEPTDPRWQRVLNRRTALHGALMDGLRDAVVGVLARPTDGSLLARGRKKAEPALAKVFENDAMATTERTHAVPIAEQRTNAAIDRPLTIEDTFIPDFVTAAQAHGAQILFIRAPLGSAKRANDVVDPALEASMVAWLGEHGAGYIDMRHAGPVDGDFGDGAHLSHAGQARFTPPLLRALHEAGYGATATIVPAEPVVVRPRPTVTRLGAPPALPLFSPVRGLRVCDWQAYVPGLAGLSDTSLAAAGLGEVSPVRVLEDGVALRPHDPGPGIVERCGGASMHFKNVIKYSPTQDPSGEGHTYTLALDPTAPTVSPTFNEAWWIYPGTSLHFAFPADPARRTSAISVRVRPPPPVASDTPQAPSAPLPQPAPPFVAVENGSPIPMFPVAEGWEVALPPAATDRPWSLDVGSPPDGPWLLLERLAIGAEDDRWLVIGDAPAPTAVDVLAGTPTFAGPPRRLYGPVARPKPAAWREGVWIFNVGYLGVPASEDVFFKAGAGCSPLRLAIDGRPAIPPLVPPGTTTDVHTTHSTDRMLVSFGDPTQIGAASPAESPHNFSFYLEETRACIRNIRWMYPGDEVDFALPGTALTRLRAGAVALAISASPFSVTAEDRLEVKVAADGIPYGSARFSLESMARDEAVLPLDKPLAASVSMVHVHMRLTTDAPTGTGNAWLLLSRVALTEPAPALFGETAAP